MFYNVDTISNSLQISNFLVSYTDNFLVYFVWEFSINPRQWSDYTCQIKLTMPSHELGEQGKRGIYFWETTA